MSETKYKNKRKGKDRLDKYYKLAKEHGYRSRAAYKLIQLNKKFNFLGSANILLDLCAAPGSWMQVASKFMPVNRMIIGVDLDKIKRIPNVESFVGDITTQKCRNEIKKLIGNNLADVVLHDGAPNMGTSWIQDAYTQNELTLSALKLASEFLTKGGTFVTKVFRSSDYNSLIWVFNKLFTKVTATKPPASRNVSAEIFVVCEGYLCPKKIDPRLLDSSFIFKEVEKDNIKQKKIDIFSNKRVRNREGYDTDSVLLFKKCSVLRFINNEEPVAVLAQNNQIAFSVCEPGENEELIKLIEKNILTTNEIKLCLADLKVLNAKDLRGLLKWREKIRKLIVNDKEEEKKPEVDETENLTEKEREDLLHLEIEDKLQRDLKRKSKKLKKREKLKQKLQMRTGLGGNIVDDVFEAPEDEGLFSLSTIRNSTQLDDVMNDFDPDIVVKEEKEEKPKALGQGDDDDDGMKRDYENEKYFDYLFDKYLEESALYRKNITKRNRENRLRNVEEIPEDLSDFNRFSKRLVDEEEVSIDIDNEDEPNQLLVAPFESKESKISSWFDNDDFAGIGEDEDDAEELKKIEQTVNTLKKKRKAEGESKGPDMKKQRTLVGPQPKPNDWEGDDEEEEENENEIVNEDELSDIDEDDFDEGFKENNEVEEVPKLDLDSEEEAELLAMGELALDPNGKRYLLDKSINRYAFDDEGSDIPRWFLDDENQHNKPQIPITKEQVEEYKQHLKAINSRSTKKVVEAKSRKKKKMMDNLKKAREKAKSIASNSDLGERDKIKQIQKIFKGSGAKSKPNKVYVVSNSYGNTKTIPKGSNLRVRLVDPRLKKDKRGRDKAEKRNKKKRR